MISSCLDSNYVLAVSVNAFLFVAYVVVRPTVTMSPKKYP